MIKVTDYICDYLASVGVKDIFMISGGGAMHLNDSIGKHRKLRYICPHHEQAAAMAAEGYARLSRKMAVVCVTSGPGGTNTITGVLGQWLDSAPVLYLSGQVKRETTIHACPKVPLRQLGDQEIDIIKIVQSITKYSARVTDAESIRYHLEKAIHLATTGRPGPVWLDIPLDIQSTMIHSKNLLSFKAPRAKTPTDLKRQVSKVVTLLKKAKRPVFLAGQGIRIAGAQKDFRDVIEQMGIPTLTSFCGADLLPTTHRLHMGRPGTLGSRYANFTLQNADLLLSVGTRNNIRQISYTRGVFARGAKKIIVDIDAAELKKPTVIPNVAICADAKDFLIELKHQLHQVKLPKLHTWVNWCRERKEKYPIVLSRHKATKTKVNPYVFMEALTQQLDKRAVVVTGDGTACVAMFQAGVVTNEQRFIWNSGCASMGYDLPAAIGACFANAKKQIICLAGDGSLQLNIQELQTIVHHRLPIKLFVLNNQGYLSIKQTQDSFFNGRRVACDAKSGVSFPDILKVAGAYGITASQISSHTKMSVQIQKVLKHKGPMVCEVLLDPDQKFEPRVSSIRLPDGRMVSKPLEDLFPFLDKKEFMENMLIPQRVAH